MYIMPINTEWKIIYNVLDMKHKEEEQSMIVCGSNIIAAFAVAHKILEEQVKENKIRNFIIWDIGLIADPDEDIIKGDDKNDERRV